MQRRTLLKLGASAAVAIALAGGGVALLRPGLVDGRLSNASRALMRAVALAVLDGSLPADAGARDAALAAHLDRLEATVAVFPPATRDELSRLLGLLGTAPGRFALSGLGSDWSRVGVGELQSALRGMNLSSSTTRQQVFHALRDLTNAAFYADASTWPLMGYPGPRSLT
jgi:hypothetical protein